MSTDKSGGRAPGGDDLDAPAVVPTRTAVLVLGMHRSGTSALTRSISLLGADLPSNLMAAKADNNETGFWESQDVYRLNDEILAAVGSRWDDWSPLSPAQLLGPGMQSYKTTALQILRNDFSGSSLFVLKDPRICRLFPFWESVLTEFGAAIKCLLPIRNPLEVAASLNRRDGISPSQSYVIWLRYVLDAELHTRGRSRFVLQYADLLADWRGVLPVLSRTLGLHWPRAQGSADEEIDAFLSGGLRHHAFSEDSLAEHRDVADWIREASALMQLLSDDPDSAQAAVSLDAVRREFDRAAAALAPVIRDQRAAIADGAERAKADEQARASLQKKLDLARGTIAAQEQAIVAVQAQAKAAERTVEKQDADIKMLKREQERSEERAQSLLQQRNVLLHRLRAARSGRWESWLDPVGKSSSPWRCMVWSVVANRRRTYCGVRLGWRDFLDLHRQLRIVMAHQAFDAQWYVERYPDVAMEGAHPLLHWMFAGWREGRQPGPKFDPGWYLYDNPDVAKAGVNPLVHYLSHGSREGRTPLAPASDGSARTAGRATPFFAPAVDMRRAVIDPGSPAAEALAITGKHIDEALAIVGARPVGRFSVVLPTWNRRETIVRAIDSVAAQSYTDWELLVCDDGSVDGTEALVRQRFPSELAQGRIRYLNLEHKGVSAARNAGLRAARGEWIAYLDSDNVWNAHYLLITAAGLAEQAHHRTAYAGLLVHDEAQQREFIRCREFDWDRLLQRNYIDLNVFAHHRALHDQLGGFDESLTRLVDWELILRYTRLYEPKFTPLVLADYFVARALANITLTEPLERNEAIVRRRFATQSTADKARLRLAYVLWDWPALSQTFVLDELRELRRRGVDVRVYYAAAPDRTASDVPDVETQRVADADELAALLVRDQRNWIHAHFAYPAGTRLAWPAAEKAGIAFSFMPHAVDIFHHANRTRNRVGEMASSPLCAKVLVHGDFHRRFLAEQGVPASKFIMTPQAVNTDPIRADSVHVRERRSGEPLRVANIGRFIEKKGVEYLIEAAAQLDRGQVHVRLYGYGPSEPAYRALIDRNALHDRVELCGTFEGAAGLRAIMDWADIVCLPCVEAENGDMDGMPTVLFEAMAAGVPCIAGAVSAIPDFISDGVTGFLVPPRDARELAAALRRIAGMPAEQLAAVARSARDWTDAHVSVAHTVDALLDCCARPPLDIFMVTYHRDGHGSWAATKRAIASVLERTTTPFVLTVVDNGSDADFLQRLREFVGAHPAVRIVPLGENRQCGPASNVALELARSEFVIYVCSNEGYAARVGWERACLRYMRSHPEVALGGRLVASPAWHDGRGYMRQAWFTDFRAPEFAQGHPDRAFHHVQGGLYVLRRSVYEAEGGFSDRRPQAQMDVEYSYYLESRGYRLGDIPGLFVVSNKTRPGLEAFVDESVLAAHPVFDETVALIEACAGGAIRRCNVCGWQGDALRGDADVDFTCPKCASSSRDRAIYRWLAGSNLHHRKLALDQRSLGSALRESLKGMFELVDGPGTVQLPDAIPGAASRVLGISRTAASDAAAPEEAAPAPPGKPSCNICGNPVFGAGPGGRLSTTGSGLPRCTQCQTLERHRAFRAALDAIRGRFGRSMRVLQFSEDRAVDPRWFGTHEVSVWGGDNSLDLQAIDRPDSSYDMVVCNHVLEHVADDRAALRELVRVLKPRGFVFLSFPDPLRRATTVDWGTPDPKQHGHYRVYGRDAFGMLADTLPQATIASSVAADPVTGATEMFFLISNEREVVLELAACLPDSEILQQGEALASADAAP